MDRSLARFSGSRNVARGHSGRTYLANHFQLFSGSATGRGGMLSGMFFASAFTLQRAIMAQLVYFALASYLAFDEGLNAFVYVAVGIAMSLAGYLILSGKLPSWHPLARFLRTHA